MQDQKFKWCQLRGEIIGELFIVIVDGYQYHYLLNNATKPEFVLECKSGVIAYTHAGNFGSVWTIHRLSSFCLFRKTDAPPTIKILFIAALLFVGWS